MSEKEKALAGLLYDACNDEELKAALYAANRQTYRYNVLPPDSEEERQQILRELLGKIGVGCKLIPPFYCDYGYNIELGDAVFANMNLVILDGGKVTIGHHVYIAPNVGIYTAGHPFDLELRRKGMEYALPIVIGNDVWIGGHSCILPGVTIGNNVVIGAGSVVTKDIPDNVLAFGNPCRVIRKI